MGKSTVSAFFKQQVCGQLFLLLAFTKCSAALNVARLQRICQRLLHPQEGMGVMQQQFIAASSCSTELAVMHVMSQTATCLRCCTVPGCPLPPLQLLASHTASTCQLLLCVRMQGVLVLYADEKVHTSLLPLQPLASHITSTCQLPLLCACRACQCYVQMKWCTSCTRQAAQQ